MTMQVMFGKRQLVVETLADRIHDGTLTHGERLGGEHQLAVEFEVSRGTIRQALGELQRRNLIATQTGIGSFVIFEGHSLDQELGWARALADADSLVSTEVREIVRVERGEIPDLPAQVELEDAMVVRRVRRLDTLSAEGVPIPGKIISFECSAIPILGAIASLPETGLKDDSIWATLAEVGIRAASGAQKVSVHWLNDREAAAMESEPGTVFLRTVRTSFSASGQFAEHVVSLLDPSLFTLNLTFGGIQ